jgi:hypothetical protein
MNIKLYPSIIETLDAAFGPIIVKECGCDEGMIDRRACGCIRWRFNFHAPRPVHDDCVINWCFCECHNHRVSK